MAARGTGGRAVRSRRPASNTMPDMGGAVRISSNACGQGRRQFDASAAQEQHRDERIRGVETVRAPRNHPQLVVDALHRPVSSSGCPDTPGCPRRVSESCAPASRTAPDGTAQPTPATRRAAPALPRGRLFQDRRQVLLQFVSPVQRPVRTAQLLQTPGLPGLQPRRVLEIVQIDVRVAQTAVRPGAQGQKLHGPFSARPLPPLPCGRRRGRSAPSSCPRGRRTRTGGSRRRGRRGTPRSTARCRSPGRPW